MNRFNPLLQIESAVVRRSREGRTYGPGEKISRLAALRAATLVPGYLSFRDDQIGSLVPGKLADAAVLDRDYLACPAEDLGRIRVLMTMLEGQVVFRRDD